VIATEEPQQTFYRVTNAGLMSYMISFKTARSNRTFNCVAKFLLAKDLSKKLSEQDVLGASRSTLQDDPFSSFGTSNCIDTGAGAPCLVRTPISPACSRLLTCTRIPVCLSILFLI
jgi:hypothetical protein